MLVRCALAMALVACGGLGAQAGPTLEALNERAAELRDELEGKGYTIVVEAPFVVIGDESPRKVRRRASGILRWSVGQYQAELFAKEPDKVIEVWLFKNERTYRRGAKQRFGDSPDTPYGYYSSQHNAIVMNIGPGAGTLTHEVVHPFIEADFPAAPAWLNEGLASLYERPTEKNGKIWGLPNWRLPSLKREIRRKTLPPLATLLATTTDEFYAAEYDSYAYARYLMLYLQEKGVLAKFYKAFRAAADDDPTGEKTLASVLDTKDLDKFDKLWRRWVLALKR
jgi:hypothetical protein